jgi:hypothetical protein
MPVTPAHAAAAWPLRRPFGRLPLSALVIGTLSPDFEYVLRLRPVGKFGHSPLGLVLFCVPATLVVWWGWRALVRPALVPLLPPGMQAAASAPPPGRRSDLVPLAIVGALLGALTHVVWDGFTHPDGWGTALFPRLQGVVWERMPWYLLLQLVSSVVGVVAVALWIGVAWLRHPRAARRFAPGQPARVAALALLLALAAAACAWADGRLGSNAGDALGRAAVGAEIGVAAGLAAYGLAARPRRGMAGERGAVRLGTGAEDVAPAPE